MFDWTVPFSKTVVSPPAEARAARAALRPADNAAALNVRLRAEAMLEVITSKTASVAER
jgi:hypothetical protein